MAAAAIPAISMGAQYFMNRKASKQRAATQAALQTLSQDLTKTGQGLVGQAQPFLNQAQGELGAGKGYFDQAAAYYSPILSGSRGAMDAALAPERQQISDTYKGAELALEKNNVRGGGRDRAVAELGRDRAGRMAGLVNQVRPGAASAIAGLGAQRFQNVGTLGQVGSNLTGQGVNAMGKAVDPLAYQQGQQSEDRKYNADQGTQIGGMIFDAIKSRKSKNSGAGALAGDLG